MKNLISIAIAALALGALGAAAADLTEQERTDLRQRAQEYQTERSRNPDFEPGEARPNREPGELHAPAGSHKSSKARKGERKAHASDKGHAKSGKAHSKDGKAHAKGEKTHMSDRVKELKKLPGALVR